MINVGIVGTGFGAKIHLPGFQNLKNVRVAGICGSSLEKTKNIAEKNNIPAVFNSWEELIASPEIDAVSIATPPSLHYKMASLAIKNHKHVMCEKPLGMTAAEAEELSASAEVASIINMIDYEFRNIPHWTWTRELLKKNHVGDLRFVSIDWISGGKAKPSTDLTWQNQKEQGGGVLFGFGPHIIDYIEWFFGPIKSVLGKLTLAKSDIKENRSSLAEDTCNMIFELESCPIISVSVSNVMPCGRGHFIEIYGEKGALKLGSGNLRDSVYGFELWEAKLGDDKATKLDLPKEFAPLDESFADGRLSVFIKQAQKFIESIESGVNAGPTFKDGLRNQIILDAIRESDKTSSWIAVN